MITLAVGPILWIPIANRYGRLPIWLISVFGAGLLNVGCALVGNYGGHLVLRILSVRDPLANRHL